jgi:hypothetical protein
MVFRRDDNHRHFFWRHLPRLLGVHDMAIDLGTANRPDEPAPSEL